MIRCEIQKVVESKLGEKRWWLNLAELIKVMKTSGWIWRWVLEVTLTGLLQGGMGGDVGAREEVRMSLTM